jgi:hypothetical protein
MWYYLPTTATNELRLYGLYTLRAFTARRSYVHGHWMNKLHNVLLLAVNARSTFKYYSVSLIVLLLGGSNNYNIWLTRSFSPSVVFRAYSRITWCNYDSEAWDAFTTAITIMWENGHYNLVPSSTNLLDST